jgi:hypothetical protein
MPSRNSIISYDTYDISANQKEKDLKQWKGEGNRIRWKKRKENWSMSLFY